MSPWRRWGCYVADRAWATVREDYSADGDAWNYFPHEKARSKAYRWGEDGIAGLCDRYQLLVFAPAFWNGRDRMLKERLFGLTSGEGNRGEDVKEYYFYLDNTPTHSYMRMLYKYPQAEYPYRAPCRREPPGGRGRAPSSSCSTRASSTRIATSMSSSSTRKPTKTTSVFASKPSIAGRMRPCCTSSRICGFAIPGRGARSAGAEPVIERERPAAAPSDAGGRRLVGRCAQEPDVRLSPRPPLPLRAAGRRAAVHQQRNQRSRRLGSRRAERQPVRQRRVSPPHHRRRRTGGEPGGHGDESVPRLSRDGAGGRVGRLAIPSQPEGDRRRRSTTSTRSSRSASRRPTSSTTRFIRRARRPTNAWCSGRRSRGCCGRSRSICSMSTSGSTATIPIIRPRRAAVRSGTRTGAT